ncbi:MAG: hypothetical protein ACPG47_01005 [Leucothrix sp.]
MTFSNAINTQVSYLLALTQYQAALKTLIMCRMDIQGLLQDIV